MPPRPLRRLSAAPRALLLLALLLPTACRAAGPRSVVRTRSEWNEALQRTGEEQLLQNVVRLRYLDTPYFLEVSSIASSLDAEVAGGLGAVLRTGATTPWDLDAGLRLAEEPTVGYAPLAGEEFARRLLSPIDLPTLALLVHSGWSIERVLRVCVQSLNGVPNAPSASGPTPRYAPEFEAFLEGARALRALQVEGLLDVGVEDGERLRLRAAPEARSGEAWRRAAEALGTDPGAEALLLVPAVETTRDGEVGVVTRSLLASLFYASQGVAVPEAHEELGLVPVTRNADGTPFDWERLTGDLFVVRTGDPGPAGAYVEVRHRDRRFYVADDDLETKSTFMMLGQLFALQSGKPSGSAPLFTLPID